MARLIDADKLVNNIAMVGSRLAKSDAQKSLIGRCIYIAEHMETVETDPMKHGEWLPDYKFGMDIMAGNTICSVCKLGAYGQPDYCPHCGAKMDGGNNNGASD